MKKLICTLVLCASCKSAGGSATESMLPEPAGGGVAAAAPGVPEEAAAPPAVLTPAEQFIKECAEKAAAWNVDAERSYICVDMTDHRAPDSHVVHGRDPHKKRRTIGNPSHLYANRTTKVGVWFPEGAEVSIVLSGVPSHVQAVYVDPAVILPPAARGARTITSRERMFPSRVPDAGKEHVTLSVNYKEDAVQVAYTADYLVEREYRGAFRTGLGVTYAWDDADYALVAGDGANPGKRIALKDRGLAALELQVGVSVFARLLREFSPRPQFGWYIGVGLAGASTKGLGLLSSIGTGPELAIGPRFSIALNLGLRFTRKLAPGSSIGDAVDSVVDAVPTRFGVAPHFGLTINMSPKVLAFVGRGGK